MRAFYGDELVLPLTQGHRFPMEKYRLLRERVTEYAEVVLQVPEATTTQSLRRAHSADYVAAPVRAAVMAATTTTSPPTRETP